MTLGILGGGLSGVVLHSLLPDAELLEKSSALGGLCRTFSKDGFSYDIGGHILFSKNEEVLSSMLSTLGENAARHYRRNAIWFKKRLIKYPFENGMPDLPVRDRLSCFFQYALRSRKAPRTFGEWITKSFGKGFADRYLIPYNEKIWKISPDDMATTWVERVPDPPFVDILKGALGIPSEGYLHQLYFYYPKTGGIESLIRAYARDRQGIRCNFEIKRISHKDDHWIVSDGIRELTYRRLISTIPITELLGALDGVPESIRAAARTLRYNSIIVAMVAYRSETKPENFAVYFPQRDLPFHRVCFPAYLAGYAPAGTSSAAAEITLPPSDSMLTEADSDIARKVIAGLAAEGFCSLKDVIAWDVTRMPYAYVVDTHDRVSTMRKIRDYVESRGIVLCGRFAEFEYLNMDAVVARAQDVARECRCSS